MRVEQELKQSQSQRIAPKMIAANQILKLSVMELQQAIEQELAENPALVQPDEDQCESCDQPRSMCIDCPFHKEAKDAALENETSIYDGNIGRDYAPEDEEVSDDVLGNIGSNETLHEYLLPLVRAIVPADRIHIAEYLVNCIGDSGYLETSVEQVSLDLNVDVDIVEETLAAIHTLDPPGVGSRSLRECLHVQLLRLAEESRGNDIALCLISEFWDSYTKGKLDRIARKLRVPLREVNEAAEFIKNQLSPYPGSLFRQTYQNDLAIISDTVKPDIVVTRTSKGYQVDVIGFDTSFINVNNRYLTMYQDIKFGDDKKYTENDKTHIISFVERAETFVKHINQRKRTLKRIAEYVINYHQGYLETDNKAFLRPLTRTMVADKLGLHESTVSRAASNKYVRLPSQELIPFDSLFGSSASLKDLIVELIDNEDPSDPLSDQQIVTILRERGYDVARRTVSKYREDEKILESRKRKRI